MSSPFDTAHCDRWTDGQTDITSAYTSLCNAWRRAVKIALGLIANNCPSQENAPHCTSDDIVLFTTAGCGLFRWLLGYTPPPKWGH